LEGKREAECAPPLTLSLTFKFTLNFSAELNYGQEKRRLTKEYTQKQSNQVKFQVKEGEINLRKIKANHAIYYECKGLVLEYKFQSLFFDAQYNSGYTQLVVI